MKSLDGKTKYRTNNIIIESTNLIQISTIYRVGCELTKKIVSGHKPKLHSLTVEKSLFGKTKYYAILESSSSQLMDILIEMYTGDNKLKSTTLHYTRGSVDYKVLWKKYLDRENGNSPEYRG